MRHLPLLALVLLAGVPHDDTPGLPPSQVVAPDPAFRLADSVRAQLTLISDLALDGDGSLYLADGTFPAVLHLEPNGELRRILGRAGDGPGEFVRVSQLGVVRDSLWVSDFGLLRVTLFPRDGRGQRTVNFGAPPRGTGAAGPLSRGLVTAMLPDGQMLLETVETADGSRGGEPRRRLALGASRELAVRDTLLVLPIEHPSMRFFYRQDASYIPQPFSDDPLMAIASDGSLLVEVERPAARDRKEAAFTVRAWRDGRTPAWSREITYRPAPLTDALVDSIMGLYDLPSGPGTRTPITGDSVRRRLYRPPVFPPVERVVVGRDRSVWLKVHFADSPKDRAEWLLLSPNGFPVRRVSTDPRFRPFEVTRATLWGAFIDPDDVPQVVRYRVPPAS